jgi:glycosyltransferase involved in cell wall biosynthesis
MAPLVSCIVPVRNAERYLAETLDSMLAQTHQSLEILVIDGRSTDSTPAIIQRYGPPVAYMRNDGDTGAASGRNFGIAAARGSFIAFNDGDDIWLPGKLAAQLMRFSARPELEISLTHLENFWTPDLPVAERWCDDGKRSTVMAGYSPVTLVARRDVFDRFGLWDSGHRHASNSEWFARAQGQGAAIELMPEVFVRRRLHGSNMTRAQSRESYDDHLRMIKELIERRRAAVQGGDTIR